MVPVADAESKRDKELAIRALPMRMGIISMSFPFRQQVEEFRQKLRLEKHGDVLTERVRGEKDESWNSFQFRGFEVERAEFDPLRPANRNLRPEDWKPKEEDWEPLPIEESYRWILINIGKGNVLKEPEKLRPVTDVGLVLPLPKPLDEKFPYPDPVARLKNIQLTLDEIAKLSEEEKKKIAPPSNLINDDFNPYQLGGGNQKANTGGGKSGDGFSIPGTGPERDLTRTQIDHCLMRFLDVSDDEKYMLKPGKTYRYRFKIRMANPNYAVKSMDRKDTYPDLAKDKELVSDWNYVDKDLTVPADTFFYAVDINPRLNPQPNHNEAVFQFHRWVEEFRAKPPGGDLTSAGEWVVAPRVIVRRGEYLRTVAPAEVPVKLPNYHNAIVMSKVPLPFGDETEWVDRRTVYPVLVDFEGGKVSTHRVEPAKKEGADPRTVTVQDDVKQEVLILNPDGRVEAHSAAVDELDPARTKRYDDYRARIDNINKKPGSENIFGK